MTPARPDVGAVGARAGVAPGAVLSPERAGALAAALAGFVIAAGAIADNSFLTHLATGRLILDGGSVPSGRDGQPEPSAGVASVLLTLARISSASSSSSRASRSRSVVRW